MKGGLISGAMSYRPHNMGDLKHRDMYMRATVDLYYKAHIGAKINVRV